MQCCFNDSPQVGYTWPTSFCLVASHNLTNASVVISLDFGNLTRNLDSSESTAGVPSRSVVKIICDVMDQLTNQRPILQRSAVENTNTRHQKAKTNKEVDSLWHCGSRSFGFALPAARMWEA